MIAPALHDECCTVADLDRLEIASEHFRVRCSHDGHVSWRCWGKGTPLVLLHGNYGSWRHWARTMELAVRFRLLVPDLPGFGSSSLPPPNIGIQDYAAKVTSTLRQLVPSGATIRIAGFSFGCRVAGQLAATWSGTVERLFLIAPGGLPLPRPSMPMLRRPGTEADDVEHLNSHRHNLRAVMFADPEMADDLAVIIQTRNVAEAKYRIKMLRDDESLHRAISTLDIPIIGIWGAEDRYSTGLLETRVHYMRHEIRRGAAFIIPNAGHWVMHEKPQETNSLLSS